MKYWSAGIIISFVGYLALVTTHVYSGDPDNFYSLLDVPFIGGVLEDRYYGDHREKAEQGNEQSMLQMYFFYEGVGNNELSRVYEDMLRNAAARGSALAQMSVDIFIDHNRRARTTRDELVYRLQTMKERDQHPEYRDMWSNRRNADAFATFLAFVAKGDPDAVEVWENEDLLWKNWDWPHSEWLRGINLAKAYPHLASREAD